MDADEKEKTSRREKIYDATKGHEGTRITEGEERISHRWAQMDTDEKERLHSGKR